MLLLNFKKSALILDVFGSSDGTASIATEAVAIILDVVLQL